MLKKLAHLSRLLLSSDRAQATVEYAVIVAVAMLLLLGVTTLVLDGLSAYYRELTWVVCLPIP